MISPSKRSSGATPTVTGVATTVFPVIRSRSPKKKDKVTSSASLTPSKRHRVTNTNFPAISYASTDGSSARVPDSGEELEVLKCILVREGYLQRLSLASAQGKISGSHLSETIDVLDLLRISTIEVVEAVVAWRKRRHRGQNGPSDTSEFLWNSLNYLLKIAPDLDFLEKHQGLVQWLGFTLVRNPFVLPVNLDARSQLDPPRKHSGDDYLTLTRLDDSSAQFVQVGGKRTIADCGSEAVAAWKSAQAAALADRKRAKNPYETRVLNDEDLVPLNSSSKRFPNAASTRSASNARPMLVLPSQIGELDMTRIRVCEQIVLEEEAVHGRYTHDIQGNLVPESEAQRRFNMVELSGNAYSQCNAESGDRPTQHASQNGVHHLQPKRLPPQSYPRKRAGMLGPISKPQQRKPLRKSLLDRSRGAHLEEALQRERTMNIELGLLLDHIREEIERKEMDLAYFESFPGVQLYGDELNEFRQKTQSDVMRLRRDVSEKEYVYNSRLASLDRKQEIVHVFKESHRNDVEHERSAVLHRKRVSSSASPTVASTNQESEGSGEDSHQVHHTQLQSPDKSVEDSSFKPRALQPLVHDMCSTLIQKIARGKLARAAYDVLKIEYYTGSKYIQAVVRGFLTRRRVAKLYWQLTASIMLQRFARGLLARRLVARRRLARSMQLSAVRIQRVTRGHFGRRRMKRVRRLFACRRELLQSSDELTLSDLKELADACYKTGVVPAKSDLTHQLPSLVLGLVRIVMVFCSDVDDEAAVSGFRWKEAAHFLRCSARLQRRMSKAAGVAATGDRYMRHSLLGSALLELYSKDDQFSELVFSSLESGWRAATILFRWVRAFNTVCQEQSVLGSTATARPFLFAELVDAFEAMQERVEEEENTIRELDLERRFVPKELVQASRLRPRGILLVFAFDVPLRAREYITDSLRRALPGVFIVMNRRRVDTIRPDESSSMRTPKVRKQQIDVLGADYTGIKESLDLGHSVILDCDVGLTDAMRRRFLGAFSALKASINPSPMCILVHGSLRNLKEDYQPDEIVASTPSPRALFGGGSMEWRCMADQDIKETFEHSANWLDRLSRANLANEMIRLSTADPSSTPLGAGLVLVMEAIVILITPSKWYAAPQMQTSGVSWKLARRLLANPHFFVRKLEAVRYDSISDNNLRVLSAYLTHAEWPGPPQTHGVSGDALHALSSWVVSVVTCAQIAVDRNGLVSPISRSLPVPGLFDNVVTCENYGTDSGVVQAYEKLLDATLADLRVYRKVHSLDARRCLISVFHDCQRIYFSAYDPRTSWRWHRIIAEEDVDTLLAPNSVERGEDATIKRTAPATQEEMYDRLVRLCLLQSVAAPVIPVDATKPYFHPQVNKPNPKSQQLVVRPPAIRLMRRVIRVGGHRITLTLAELSRGRIQVDISVHTLSLELRDIVNVEEILERLNYREARDIFVPPEQLPSLVLERLHLFRLRQTRDSVAFQTGQTVSAKASDGNSPSLKLAVRKKAAAPGRVLIRKAVRSRWLSLSGHSPGVWLFTVFEHHRENRFSVEVYQPRSCQRFSRTISQREFNDMQLSELCQRPSSATAPMLLRKIIGLLQFHQNSDEIDDHGASITACTLRHHVLARFPLAIRFVSTPHHEVDKGGAIRTYVQVETQDRIDSRRATEDLRLRILLPECCQEQELVWRDAEVDSCLSDVEGSWMTMPQAHRAKTAYNLAHSLLRWDPLKSRVVAGLPCGDFEARLSTRDTEQRKTAESLTPQLRSKKSMFSVRSSRDFLPAPRSCVILLDVEFTELDATSTAPPSLPQAVFVYDRDELVLSGSYRANGVLLTVQVFMRAIVSRVVKLRLPVDRVEHDDSFEIAFNFYHPGTSSSQRCAIHGRTELREVVGPERAALISSSTTRELMEHIVESRTSVEFDTVLAKDHTETKSIVVSFVRDRLFAKHKATPLQYTLDEDATKNAVKLIDSKPDRGLKLLSLAKTLADGSGGKVILTVFDVSHTRALHSMTGLEREAGIQLRVDCYVCDSSARLSMAVEGVDLLHLFDHASLESSVGLKNMLLSQSVDSESVRQQRLWLARLVADHIGVERKRDGTPDRLYLTDMPSTPSRADNLWAGDTERRLLGRAVRQVQGAPITASLFAVRDKEFRGLELRCYEPHSSATAAVAFSPPSLSTILGFSSHDVDYTELFDCLDRATASALLTHILTHVQVNGDKETVGSLKLSTTISEGEENSSERTQCEPPPQNCDSKTLVRAWRRLITASGGTDLCVLSLQLRATDIREHEVVDVRSAELMCSAYSIRRRLAATRIICSEEIAALIPSTTTVAIDVLQECLKRIHLRVTTPGAEDSRPSIGTPRAPQILLTIEWSC